MTQRQPLTTSYIQTCAQSVSKQQLLWKAYSPSCIAEHDIIWHRIALWLAEVSCPDCVLLPTPRPLAGGAESETEESLTLCKHFTATAKAMVCYYYTVVVTNPNTTPHGLLCRIFTPFHSDTVHCICNTTVQVDNLKS